MAVPAVVCRRKDPDTGCMQQTSSSASFVPPGKGVSGDPGSLKPSSAGTSGSPSKTAKPHPPVKGLDQVPQEATTGAEFTLAEEHKKALTTVINAVHAKAVEPLGFFERANPFYMSFRMRACLKEPELATLITGIPPIHGLVFVLDNEELRTQVTTVLQLFDMPCWKVVEENYKTAYTEHQTAIGPSIDQFCKHHPIGRGLDKKELCERVHNHSKDSIKAMVRMVFQGLDNI